MTRNTVAKKIKNIRCAILSNFISILGKIASVCVRCPADKQYKEGWKSLYAFKIATVRHEKELGESWSPENILIFIAQPPLIRHW